MPPWFSSPTQRYRVLLIGAMLVLCLWIIIAAWTALVPFVLGALLAYILLPAVNFCDQHSLAFLRRKGWSRPLAIIVVYLIVFGLIAATLSSFIPLVTEQAKRLYELAPSYLQQIGRLYTGDFADILDNVPPEIRAAVEANLQKAGDTLTEAIQTGVGVTLKTVSQTVSFVIGMIIIPFWVFYVLNDDIKVRRGFYSIVPEKARADVHCVVMIINDLLSAYIRGQLLLCFLVGSMVTVVLLIFGLDFAVLLGTLAGIFELIPILGPYLGAIPAVLIALMNRPTQAFWVALSFAAIQQLENVFLVPRIAGNAVRFHPAIVMVVVIVGSEVAGLWGMLLGVPVAAVIRDVFQYLYLRTTERGATPELALECLRARSL